MDSTFLNGAVVAQIVALVGLILKQWLERKKTKEESSLIIQSVRGMESKVTEMVFEQRELKSDFRFSIKLHNKLNKIANRYSIKFGLAGGNYGKIVFFWAKLIEQFASDYYFSDFRTEAKGEKSELKEYISDQFKHKKDEYLEYVNELFSEPKYDKKNKPYMLANMIEGSRCFMTYQDVLIIDLLNNGFNAETFQIKIAEYLSNFFIEFEKIAKDYLTYGEPKID